MNTANVACTVDCDGADRVSDPAVAAHLYRIAQEAVTNALKHGKARNISIRLSSDGGLVRLSVRDDGVGLPETFDEKKGMGLRTMRYRANVIGAAFRVAPGLGGGTVVECALHLESTQE